MHSVWKGQFLREATYRLMASRTSAAWLFFAPLFHTSYLIVGYTVIKVRSVGGIDTTLWLLSGILTYVLFRRTFRQTTAAISANTALFTYRQVKPIDTLLVRAVLEFLIVAICAIVMFSAVFAIGHDIQPVDPLTVMAAVLAVWIIAMSLGMLASVAENLAPVMHQVNRNITTPLYVLSGTMAPIARAPEPYQSILMLNPIAHALELVRIGYSPYYAAANATSMSYLWGCALVLLFAGLVIQRRFALRLMTQ